MNYRGHIVLFLMPLLANAQQGDHQLRKGNDAYHKGALVEARRAYEKAAQLAPNDPRTFYNLGTALVSMGSVDEATAQFEQAIAISKSEEMQARSYYNLATGHLQRATASTSRIKEQRALMENIRGDRSSDIVQRVHNRALIDSLKAGNAELDKLVDASLSKALEHFKNTLRRTPGDEDARHNLALTQRMIAMRTREKENGSKEDKKEDEVLSELAKKIIAQAEALVDAYKFEQARDLMQAEMARVPELQQKKEFVDKLDAVMKAATVQR